MEFIGTEVGIKIRSAIKAKLAEIGKTVDDELIDYIMVMVANKKEESQMARDLQPFLEYDTIKFTSWLHKVLQKLEQVTVIVTDDEYKIATSAFSKGAKKRKTSESSNKKKSNAKDEPKEKKKKVKHEHGKHSKSTGSAAAETKSVSVSKVQTASATDKQSKSKKVIAGSKQINAEVKTVKAKKSKVEESEVSIEKDKQKNVEEKQTTSKSGAPPVATSVQDKKAETVPTKSPNRSVVGAVQRPVMMVSDDDDDDDDFINIKTDMAEEELLLEEDRGQRTSVPDTPAPQPDDAEEVAPVLSKLHAAGSGSIKVEAGTSSQEAKAMETEAALRAAVVASCNARTLKAAAAASSLASKKPMVHPAMPTTSPQHPVPSSVVQMPATSRPFILSRIGAVLKRKASPDDDEDEDARNGSVASVIKVKPRPKLPASAQAPKTLLLRAMADAQRSIASAPSRVPPDSQSKARDTRSPLFTKKFRDLKHGPEMLERLAITLPNVQDPNALDMEEELVEQSELNPYSEEPDEAYVPELVATPSTLPVDVIYSPSPIVRTSTSKEDSDASRPRSTTPEFLVTLDGYKNYDYAMHFDEGENGNMEEEEYEPQAASELIIKSEPEKEEIQEELEPPKPHRQKIVFNSEKSSEADKDASKHLLLKSLDRCRFWPACRLGDACTFHHPTQPCKTFPTCSFGDRCLYIHPNCKFDAACSRKDCPFTHASPRNLSVLAAAPIVPVGRPAMQRLGSLTCRFYPNCSNTNCRFFHPKPIAIPCRYGRLCSKPDCSFSHSDIPPKEKMKWVSTVR